MTDPNDISDFLKSGHTTKIMQHTDLAGNILGWTVDQLLLNEKHTKFGRLERDLSSVHVTDDFYAPRTGLDDLTYLPGKITGDCHINRNQITTLDGLEGKKVEGVLLLRGNPLTPLLFSDEAILRGAPQKILADLNTLFLDNDQFDSFLRVEKEFGAIKCSLMAAISGVTNNALSCESLIGVFDELQGILLRKAHRVLEKTILPAPHFKFKLKGSTP